MTIFTFLLFGLIIGSFLNVVVYRIREAESILGRSYCPHCKKGVRWYDNVPVLSFILLWGKCRDCKKKISWQYPLVEIGTGLIFALVGWKFFVLTQPASWLPTFYYLAIFSALVVIFVYDYLYLEIPEIVLWPSVGFAVAYNLVADWSAIDFPGGALGGASFSGNLAAILVFLFFFILSALSRERWMGMGDAYLVILLGLITGWPQILLALFLAFAIGAVCGIILIAFKKKKMKSQLPFGPFLILGMIVSLFWYAPMVDWYFTLLK